nr:SJCHGC08896 protein [Schistosoma japonicum]
MGINRKYKIVKSCVLVKGEACTRNPIHAASQKDKAAALLNHEFSCNGVCRSVSPQIYNRSRSTSVRRV